MGIFLRRVSRLPPWL